MDEGLTWVIRWVRGLKQKLSIGNAGLKCSKGKWTLGLQPHISQSGHIDEISFVLPGHTLSP